MRFEGILTTWNEEKGHGLIAADQGGQDIVVAQSALRGGPEKPRAGQRVSFEIEPAAGGYKRARNVATAPSRREIHAAIRRGRRGGVGPASMLAVPLFLVVFLLAAVAWGVPAWVGVLYVAMSVVAATTYAMDHRAVGTTLPRVSESTLLMMALAGGWPGGLLVMQLTRHKTAKPVFQVAFWLAVVLNVAAFLAWVSRHGPVAA